MYHAVAGKQCVAAGNMLAGVERDRSDGPSVREPPGPLADRLLAAMHAAMAAGGEAGPVHSAALKIVGDHELADRRSAGRLGRR